MPTPLSPTRLFVCTACGAVLPVGEELVGKKCRCGRCGMVNLVTEDSSVDSPPEQFEQTPAPDQTFGFPCRVCGTRLAARVKHVGRKAKCPDCGALTKVPPPPQPRPKNKPKAMHGQQYGLWGVEGAPNPDELAAKQPKFFPVYCRNCDTLMHAQLQQVGKKLACPDCGAKTVVEQPPKPEPKKSSLVPDGQEYQLDATHVPPVRPKLQFEPPTPVKKPTAEESIRTERTDRPKMPRVPILQGVSAMMFRNPVVGWWFGLSIVGCIELGILAIGLTGHVLLKLLIVPPFLAIGVVGFSAAGAFGITVLTESSEGNDRMHHPPGPVFLDWMGSMFYVITSGMLALAPWWLICRVLEKDLTMVQQGIIETCGWLFTFPLLLLSCLENGSPLELFSPQIFSSVTKRPGHWLLFFVETVVLAGVCLVSLAAMLTYNPKLVFLAVPLCVAASLLYFRILGRFAWWLAESLATAEKETTDEE